MAALGCLIKLKRVLWFFHTNTPYLTLYRLTKFQRHNFFTGYQTKCVTFNVISFLQDIKQNVLLSSYLDN